MRKRFASLAWWMTACAVGLCMSARVRAQETETEEHEHAAEHEEARLQLGLDLVFGFDRLPRRPVEAFAPTVGALMVPATQLYEPGAGSTDSLLLAGSYELLPHLRVGARIGVGLGNHVTGGNGEYGVIAALSNLELEAEYALELAEGTELAVSLGIALPTASGGEVEPDDWEPLARGEARTALLQDSVQRGIAASRGFEDNALFEYRRLGVIPKVSLLHHRGALQLEAFAKLENLISTASEVEHRAIVELIAGGFAGYAVISPLVLGLRAWTSLNLTESGESAIVLEPQARWLVGPLTATAGLLVGVAGPYDVPAILGVRLAAAARF